MISDVTSIGPRGGRASVAPSAISSSVFEDSNSTNEAQILSLSQDTRYVSRLYKKIAMAYVDRGANGIAVLNEKFIRLDKTLNDENFYADQWSFKSFLRSGESTLTDKELSVLFLLLDAESTGEIDLAEVMLHLRKQFHCTTQQFHDIIKRVRSMRLKREECPWTAASRESRRTRGRRVKDPLRGVRAEAFDYLVYEGKLTQSEAFLVLEKCTAEVAPPSGDPSDPSNAPIQQELDAEYLETVLFDFPMPHDVAYPILIGKLVESLTDPATSHSGTMGILKAAHQVRLVVDESSFKAEEERKAVEGDGCEAPENSPSRKMRYWGETEAASPSRILKAQELENSFRLMNKHSSHIFIDRAQFRQLVAAVGGGLPAGEADVLFSYLADPASELLTLSQLIKDCSKRFPVPSPHKLQLSLTAVRSQIVGNQGGVGLSGGGGAPITSAAGPAVSVPSGISYFGLNALHLALSGWGEAPYPIDAAITAIRKCGVAPSITADIEIESICLQAPTCVELVLLLRGVLPKGRLHTLKQLFQKLDTNSTGLVDRSIVHSEFSPGALDSKVGVHTAALERDLRYFINSLPPGDEMMSFEEFTYFWGNISASIAEDATFTLLMWRGYACMGNDHAPVTPSRRARVGAGCSPANKAPYDDDSSSVAPSTMTPRRKFRKFLGE